jgi:hypothetical protein
LTSDNWLLNPHLTPIDPSHGANDSQDAETTAPIAVGISAWGGRYMAHDYGGFKLDAASIKQQKIFDEYIAPIRPIPAGDGSI